MKLHQLLLLIVSIALFSCQKEFKEELPNNVWGMDLKDAKYFAVDKESTEYTNLRLLKSDEKSTSEVVNFIDSEKTTIDPEYISANSEREPLIIGNNHFLLQGQFVFETADGQNRYYKILVNNSTGKMYNLSPYDMEIDYYNPYSSIKTDANGNAYFFAGYTDFINEVTCCRIMKLSGLNEGNPAVEEYVSGEVGISYFHISPNGDCFINDDKVKLASGGIYNLGDIGKNFFSFNSEVYSYGTDAIKKITYVNGEYTSIKVADGINASGSMVQYSKENEVLLLYSRYCYNSLGFVFIPESNEAHMIPLPTGLSGTLDANRYGNYYYISATDDSWIRIDLRNEGSILDGKYELPYEKVTLPEAYTVNGYKILSNGDITFDGYDLQNEIRISGIIKTDGTISIIDGAVNMGLTPLKTIN